MTKEKHKVMNRGQEIGQNNDRVETNKMMSMYDQISQ